MNFIMTILLTLGLLQAEPSAKSNSTKSDTIKKKLITPDESKRKPQMSYEEEEAQNIMANSNCLIIITTVRKSGISEVQTLHTTAESAEECARKTQPHRYNMYPDQIKTKKVTYRFLK